MRRVSIHCGDSLKVLRTMKENSIDSMISDPPAGISFMSKGWDSDFGGVEKWKLWLSKIMKEALRVLKPGAHGLVWSIPRTSHWTGTALEMAGFEIRDVISHIYGSGFPKNHNIGKAIDKTLGEEREVLGLAGKSGKKRNSMSGDFKGEYFHTEPASEEAKLYEHLGTALKPSGEAWWVVRKPFGILDYTLPSSDRLELIKEALCLFLSNAKIAKQSSKLTKAHSKEDSQSIVQELAQTKTKGSKDQKIPIGEGDDSQGKMAMFSFDVKTANIVLSIVSSWLNILKEISKRASMFTTKTGIDLITDLRILNSLILQTTQNSIARDVLSQNGSLSVARIAGDLLSACLLKSNAIQALSVIGSVGKIADFQKRMEETQQEEGKEETGEPSSEMWWLIRKPFDGTIANCVLDYGTGALNIDGSRVEYEGGDSLKGKIIHGPKSGQKYGGTSYTESSTKHPEEGIAANDKGRWPPNTVFTHHFNCDDGACSVECPIWILDQESGTTKQSGSKKVDRKLKIGFQHSDFHAGTSLNDSGGASRYFPKFRYQPKPSREEKEAGLSALPLKRSQKLNEGGMQARRDAKAEMAIKSQGLDAKGRTLIREDGSKTLVDRFIPGFRSNNHPTVKPIELMQWLIKLITPEGGTVLDPFMGSGTTGCAAVFDGFGFVGIDLSQEYCDMSKKRMEFWSLKGTQSISKKEELDGDGKPVQIGFDFG